MPESFSLTKEILDNFSAYKDNFRSLPILKMPVDKYAATTPNAPTLDILNFQIQPSLQNDITILAQTYNVSTQNVFTAAFLAVLQRHTTQEDFFLTQLYTDSNQAITGFKGIRSKFDSAASFTSLIKQLPETVSDNSQCLDINNTANFLTTANTDKEVFRACLLYSEGTVNDAILKEALNTFPSFRLALIVNNNNFDICYSSALFTGDFIGKFAQHFVNLLTAAVAQPDKSTGAHQILTAGEWQNIMVDFNNTITPYPQQQTLFGLFEEKVLTVPNAIALRKGNKTITYAQLNTKANQLAHFLIAKGVLPGHNIGLLVARDFDMITGMLAILKAGGAYVPIDPDYPIDRQEYIYNQSSLKLILADNHYPIKSLLNEGCYIRINVEKTSLQPDSNPGLTVNSKQLAYTIYTSGSTGRPKGVMIKHHSAVNLVLWVNKEYNVGVDDNLLFITSMCFDLSVYDIFGMLAAGGTVVIAEYDQIQDVKQLQRMLIDYDITFWDSVPTTLDYLVRNLEITEPDYRYEGLKTIFMSGDWIPVDLPDRIKRFLPQTQVISLGGATEGTVWSNFFAVKETLKHWKSIPYGKPLDNNFFYILNEQLQPVPQGVIGDLYIGGVGVARGYANDEAKTRAQFMPDTFNTELGGMMYKTGDLGRMAADMNMEFIGRKDNQVKISGFRVELGEIESVLNTSGLLTSAVVLAKNDPEGKKRLIAYVVAPEFDKYLLTSYLNTKLPHYMVPALWVKLDQLPLTSNGKIDRNSLPDFDETLPSKAFLQPSTATEKILKDIWLECLGLTDISIDDNFFELGGHSLIAAQILSLFKNKTGHNLQLAILFEYTDIQSLAAHIDSKTSEIRADYTCLVPIKPTGSKPPLYIIHGEGLNVLKFSTLAASVDPDQPIWGLQARGLNGVDEPMDDMQDIANDYLSEIFQHNPNGPYLLGGYSFGGYVAVEMHRLMTAMGKEPKALIMFDTDSERMDEKNFFSLTFQKLVRNAPKMLSFFRSNFGNTNDEFKLPSKNLSEKDIKAFYAQIKKIQKKHVAAFNNYQLLPFDAKIYLFRADISVHYVDDEVYLGWTRYAKRGVEVFAVPGDHRSMLEPPNVKTLAMLLQRALNKITK